MSKSSKKQLYFSILGLCGIALLADRTLFAPSEAAADDAISVASQGTDVAVESVPDLVVTERRATPAEELAARLESVVAMHELQLSDINDAFSTPRTWLPAETVVALEPRTSNGELFRSQHRLTAVMAGSDSGYAIIDGKTLFVGQELDGFTLSEVTNRSAVLHNGSGATVELKLPERPGAEER
ncbi:MAG: hypothetical protein ACYTGC_18165 [Planctomycetota bacterium]|jgi:hypothetical protein